MDLNENVNSDPRRALPSVTRLATDLSENMPHLPSWIPATAAQLAIEAVRSEIELPPGETKKGDLSVIKARCLELAMDSATRLKADWPRKVINATGVTLHTNLGRAPLALGAVEAASAAGLGYTNLELDLETGGRGDRLASVREKLCLLAKAEDAYACNNNAAAVLLALNSLAAGRQVLVSRGELVEIGGSFRVPEIMKKAGVELVEVGSTNRTHPHDFEQAIGPKTALLLKVHRSNFQQTGFVTEVSLGELVRMGQRHGVPVMEDLGSGSLLDLSRLGVPSESFVPSRLELGPDLVCFSGDKLFGGPQAGLILGKKDSVELMKKNPLARALRLDKMALAALDFTLSRMLDGSAEREIPVLRQIFLSASEHEARTQRFADVLTDAIDQQGLEAVVSQKKETVPVGGGSLPGFDIHSCVLTIQSERSAEDLAARLRGARVPILPRIREGRVMIDLRAVLPADETDLQEGLLDSLR